MIGVAERLPLDHPRVLVVHQVVTLGPDPQVVILGLDPQVVILGLDPRIHVQGIPTGRGGRRVCAG
ncbi:hypothetical protein CN186_22265 [Sinorhizobium medicae]|uniref:Uncharacterized protein n=1 Tax=Sinorhizobium medicae TaxID=110321 RepID=A0A508X556_9HYPH|nr:hypothetical protein CN186_22265 [Sinorhizobium medicae]VTZ64657.1 hypothetical protein EMEDMD4_650012 [Sinorhizobium medicae]